MPQEEITQEQLRKLAEERQRQEAALQAAQQAALSANSGASGTVNTYGTDITQQSGTRTQQNSTSNSMSVNTGSSVSSQQGRSESYSMEGMTPEQRAQYIADYTKMHPGYTLSDKGEVVRDPNASLYDALQIDRKRLSDERERQERIQRMRKLEHGLANSAMLISDMISAGIGGNVYKRDKDKTNEEADKEIARLREQQIAEDMAAKEKEKQDRDKWSADLWRDLDNYRRSLYRNVSENSSTGSQQSVQQGQQFQTSQQSGKSNTVQTSNYGKNFRKNIYGDYGFSGGSHSADNYIVKLQMKDGSTVDINMPKGQYESTGRYLSALYNALSKADGDNIKKVLSDAGIKPIKTGKDKYTYNGADLLSSGIVFEHPRVRSEFVKAIMNDPLISYEDKIRITEEMQTYPIAAPKEVKRNWFQRLYDNFKKDDTPANDEFNGLFTAH